MKINQKAFLLIPFIFLLSCSDSGEPSLDPSGTSGGPAGNYEPEAGVITAAEWSDLDNWPFWQDLLQEEDNRDMDDHWQFYTNGRIALLVRDGGIPLRNARVSLIKNDQTIWSARTDNAGSAELWTGLFQYEEQKNLNDYQLMINDQVIEKQLIPFEDGINEINISSVTELLARVEISFIVDATGSMGDEIAFLKEDLKSVIEQVKQRNGNIEIATSTVFYRDEFEEYVVKKSDFTIQIDSTVNFIQEQVAVGGGDYEEAVHTALSTSITELQWSENATTKIAFLLLDAPPHDEQLIKESIHESVRTAAQYGIKVIPITAGGINKETEFLMRFLAIATNGTYVFITDDSGVGSNHLTASVGQYEVELLNDLMVRLINEYID